MPVNPHRTAVTLREARAVEQLDQQQRRERYRRIHWREKPLHNSKSRQE